MMSLPYRFVSVVLSRRNSQANLFLGFLGSYNLLSCHIHIIYR